jgi:hypothetical protein
MPDNGIDKVSDALRTAQTPLTVAEIARIAFGRTTERSLSATRVYLHRLDACGKLLRHPRKYEWRR